MNLDRLTDLQVYRIVIRFAQIRNEITATTHRHHISPRCLYRQLQNDEGNIVPMDALLHAVSHWYLARHFRNRDEVAYDKLAESAQDILDFIHRQGWSPVELDLKDVVDFFDRQVLPEMAAALATDTAGSPDMKRTADFLDRYLACHKAARGLEPDGIEDELKAML